MSGKSRQAQRPAATRALFSNETFEDELGEWGGEAKGHGAMTRRSPDGGDAGGLSMFPLHSGKENAELRVAVQAAVRFHAVAIRLESKICTTETQMTGSAGSKLRGLAFATRSIFLAAAKFRKFSF